MNFTSCGMRKLENSQSPSRNLKNATILNHDLKHMTAKDDQETLQFISDLKHQVQDLSKNNVWLRNRLNYYRKQNDTLANKTTYNHIQPKVDTNLNRKKKDYVSLVQSMHPNADVSILDSHHRTEAVEDNISSHAPIRQSTNDLMNLSSIQNLLQQAIEPHLHSIEEYSQQLAVLKSQNAVLKERDSQQAHALLKLKDKLKEVKHSKKDILKNKEYQDKLNFIQELQDQVVELENKLKLKESASIEKLSVLKLNNSEIESKKDAKILELQKKIDATKPWLSLLKRENISISDLESYLKLINHLNDLDILQELLQNPELCSNFNKPTNITEIQGLRAALEEEKLQSEKHKLENQIMNARFEKLNCLPTGLAKENVTENAFVFKISSNTGVDLNNHLLCVAVPHMEPTIIDKMGVFSIQITNTRQFFLNAFVKPIEICVYTAFRNKLELVQSLKIPLEKWLTECVSTSEYYECNLEFDVFSLFIAFKLDLNCDYMIRTLLADLTCLKLNDDKCYVVRVAGMVMQSTFIKMLFGNQYCLVLNKNDRHYEKKLTGGTFALIGREIFTLVLENNTINSRKSLADLVQQKFTLKENEYLLELTCLVQTKPAHQEDSSTAVIFKSQNLTLSDSSQGITNLDGKATSYEDENSVDSEDLKVSIDSS
eukprot:NODE_134_length_18141_cov_0.186066.p3 type:complete len:658 gc:universal NODE_134_length_18141_cov_0.186066:4314-2341(-)